MIEVANFYDDIPPQHGGEHVTELLASPNIRIERIVSRGHAGAPGEWYDQDRDEWVMLVSGSAGLLFEGEYQPRLHKAGDYAHIPAHSRIRPSENENPGLAAGVRTRDATSDLLLLG
jgi:cupin 2 domain-containing protein